MIKVEETKTGLRTEVCGKTPQILTEFTAIVEGLYDRDVLDEDLYKTCWEIATKKGDDRVDYMKKKVAEEIEKTIKEQKDDDDENKIEEKVDEIMKEIVDFIKNQC